jgi:hypothetical protein
VVGVVMLRVVDVGAGVVVVVVVTGSCVAAAPTAMESQKYMSTPIMKLLAG